jgi:hypothetical protein
MIIIGAFNAIEGLVSLFRHRIFVTNGNGLIVFNYTAWGWILLILGAVQILIGLFVLRGSWIAQLAAIFILILDSIAQISFLTAEPFWSIIVIVLNVIVIWALCVHGEEAQRPAA